MIPVLFRLGPFTLYSFGLMAALAFLAGRWILLRGLETRGIPAREGEAYTWAALVGGIGGAHLYYLIENWRDVRIDPVGIVLSGSGLVWYGGLAGGILACLLVLARKKHPLGSVADAFGPALTAAYLLGRVGCQLAGDGDYGRASDLPWAMAYPNGTVPTLERVHPTPVYEVLAMIGVFVLLKKMERGWIGGQRPPAGSLFWAYVGLASLERFLVEFLRRNPDVALGLTTAQWISAAGITAAAAGSLHLRRRPDVVSLTGTAADRRGRGERG